MANKNASWSKPKSESAICHCTGLWKILGANWSSWRRGGRIWQTLIILNWNGFLLLLVGSSWSATQVFRWTVPTAELWKMKLYICILIFPRQASLILWFISSKNETNYYKTFLKPYLPRPFPAYYGINVKSNFSGVDASCQNISF